MSVFNLNNTKSHTDRTMFFDEPVDIARYDTMKYPQFDKLTERQWGYFWRPQEVVLTRDKRDFAELQPHEQHIFTSNLKRQILLDSVQGRAPALAFLPLASLPEVENFITAWQFFESIHSKSYTHILRNVYSNPSVVFDGLLDIQEIVDCAKDISEAYDELIKCNSGINLVNGSASYEHKKAFWMCLNAVNALEGIRFYVSFACSWAFAELKKMEGNAKIIKLIARDENLHLAFTQQLIRLLPKEDPDFAKIAKEMALPVERMFIKVVEQEKVWATYLFQHGSMIGINTEIAHRYIEWLAFKRMTAINLTTPYNGGTNPLPWTQKWIAGSDVQVAPQETEKSEYIVGAIKQDLEPDTFKGFKL